ncbi:MAG: hypothetical protein ACO3JL_12070 [Myxococcota bacterium]
MAEKGMHREGRATLNQRRAEALLGTHPTFTFEPPEADGTPCCAVRLVRGGTGEWFGLVRDRSVFAERVRLGVRPRFVVYHEGETPLVCGDADVRLGGRVHDPAVPTWSACQQEAISTLLGSFPFPADDLCLLQVKLGEVRVDDGDAPFYGAVPRT